jgi:acyl dehydratase
VEQSSDVLYFEDVAVGIELPRLTRGPLTTMHLMRWSAAMENWHRIHYDETFATGHDKLPGLLIAGSLKQQFIVQLLKDWVGHTGWVWKIDFQFRSMNIVNETLRAWARVTGKHNSEAFGLITLDVGLVNEHDKESTPGKATVALPYRGGRPVPYPFVPPSANG